MDIGSLPEDTALNQNTSFISNNGKVSKMSSMEEQIVADLFTADLGPTDPNKTLTQEAEKQLYNTIQGQIESIQDTIVTLDSSVVHKDGSSTMTGDFNIGFNKIVNLADPVDPNDGVNKDYIDQLIVNQGTVQIAIDAYQYYTAAIGASIITFSPTTGSMPTQYIDGQRINFTSPATLNTASFSAQIGTLTAKPIIKSSDLQATQPGDIQQNYNYTLVYNENDFASSGSWRLFDTSTVANKIFSGVKNRIINGDFRIWQRNQTFTNITSGAYNADRFKSTWDAVGSQRTVSRQAFAAGELEGPGLYSPYYLRVQQTTAGSGGTFNALLQFVEDVRSLSGQVVTLSFYARFITGTNTLIGDLRQYFGTGGTPSSPVVVPFSFGNIGTNWSKCSVTVQLPSLSGKALGTNNDHYLQLTLALPVNQIFTADIAYVQLEVGSIATPFETRSLASEIALCQRYYEKSYELDNVPGATVNDYYGALDATGGRGTSGSRGGSYLFKVTKRAVPTVTFWNPAVAGTQGARNSTTAVNVTGAVAINQGANSFRIASQLGATTDDINFHFTADAEF